MSYPIKKFGAPLNLLGVATTIGFAGFFRTLEFMMILQLPVKIAPGMGYAGNDDALIPCEDGVLTLDGFARVFTRVSCLQKIADCVDRVNAARE